jgi:hypothetical protein
VRNTTIVPPPKTPEEGYRLSEDLADDAIGRMRAHKALEADKPFFMYWASGCLQHGPHHIMKEWAYRHAGTFDDGWDAYRERVFDRANESGWIPPEAELTTRDPNLAANASGDGHRAPSGERIRWVGLGFHRDGGSEPGGVDGWGPRSVAARGEAFGPAPSLGYGKSRPADREGSGKRLFGGEGRAMARRYRSFDKVAKARSN